MYTQSSWLIVTALICQPTSSCINNHKYHPITRYPIKSHMWRPYTSDKSQSFCCACIFFLFGEAFFVLEQVLPQFLRACLSFCMTKNNQIYRDMQLNSKYLPKDFSCFLTLHWEINHSYTNLLIQKRFFFTLRSGNCIICIDR